MPSSTSAALNGLAAGCSSGSSSSSTPSGSSRRDDGQPAGSPSGMSFFFTKPEHVGVEAQALAWSSTRTLVTIDPHRGLLPVGLSASGRDLAAAAPCRGRGTCTGRRGGSGPGRLFEHVEVLRDRLPGRPETVLRGQPRAELEQRLAVALGQLIEDRPPGRIRQRLEDVAHATIDRQVTTCLSMLAPVRLTPVDGANLDRLADSLEGQGARLRDLEPGSSGLPRATSAETRISWPDAAPPTRAATCTPRPL